MSHLLYGAYSVAKMIKTLVFTTNQLKMVLSQLFPSFNVVCQ